ncbi:hypothetical protein BUALT_Bualt13G0082100 [Buddleja alternifolia]|uniref:AP2/ERF domain-containing protein n=1 Tax=Buddleja alternifolia TaxID=168488 RepID=A0AAV6WLH0_9LAMI|nr:hypothetical protein BUALT_Bualt13G0082100 [Buddleja alternifolia]
MFDLNQSVSCNGKEKVVEAHSSNNNSEGQSRAVSFSSVLKGERQTSSSNDGDTCSTRASPTPTFNFGTLISNTNSNDDRIEKDCRDHAESSLVTRQLFPVRQISDSVDLPVQQQQQQQVQARKNRRGPRSRSSQYRGVTFYRRTGRWESHIWDSGKQVYLGGFDTALAAARAYDRAAIKFRGVDADINFNLCDYDEDMKQTNNLSKEEFVHILRRHSTGFSRGSSKYRGVTLHKCGRWEARMGQFLGKKAYDKAAIKCNGRDVVTNFEPSMYNGDMISEPVNERGQNDLDLNLGISTSSPKESGNLGSVQFHTYDVQNARILKERASYKQRPELVFPQEVELAYRASQMHNQVRATPIATWSAAASSGFLSTATRASPYPTAIDQCFSSYPHTSAYTSQCYSQIRPSLPHP